MKRLVLTTLAGLTAFALMTGLAASMQVNSADLGSGSDTLAACDQDGIDVSFGVAAGSISNVEVVTLELVAAACEGQTFYLQLLDGTGNELAAETGAIALLGGDSQDVTLGSVVPAASIEQVNLTITG